MSAAETIAEPSPVSQPPASSEPPVSPEPAASPASPVLPESPQPTESPEATTPRRSLGRPFAAQLTSTGLANLGDGVLGTLAPLVALTLTTSPAQISLLQAAAWLPWLVLGIVAGAVVDRLDRRTVQVVSLLVRATLLATGAWLAATDRLSMTSLLVLVLVYGVTEVFADLGATAIVPALVPRDRLSAANGRILGVQQVANAFVGAPLAGALLAIGAGVAFGTSAGLAALAAVVLAVGLRGRFRAEATSTRTTAQPTSSPARALRAGLGQVREGLAFLLHHPVLRPLTITSAVLNMASTAYFAVFVLWAVGPGSPMGLTPQQFPLLTLGLAAGAVVGSLLAEKVQNRFGEMPTLVTTLTVNVLLLLVPLLWPSGWAVAGALTVVGFLNTIGNVVSMSLRQRISPSAMLGRIGGAGRTLSYGLMPVGALVGGLVAERWGLPTTFVGAVVVSLVACGYVAARVRTSTVRDAERAHDERP